ncbi:MAG: hypothetical protein ACK5UY_07495 [Holosporales bacterium]
MASTNAALTLPVVSQIFEALSGAVMRPTKKTPVATNAAAATSPTCSNILWPVGRVGVGCAADAAFTARAFSSLAKAAKASILSSCEMSC